MRIEIIVKIVLMYFGSSNSSFEDFLLIIKFRDVRIVPMIDKGKRNGILVPEKIKK